MYELYHRDSVKNTDTLIGTFETVEELRKAASDYLDKIKFKSYYWRGWSKDGIHWIDYGSHTKFFYWKEA